MRPRHDTIGGLGRAPARASKAPPMVPLPPKPEPPDRSQLRRWVHGALFDNVGLKFLSMVLAVTVFLLVNTDRDREISQSVTVTYTLPDDKMLTSERLSEVHITIKGSARRINRLGNLEPINLDLRHAASGDFPITPDMFHVPSGMQITSITPHTVPVAFDRRVEKVVEVTPQVTGHPQHGFVISEVQATPTTVKVRGAEGTLAALSSVHTKEVLIEGRAEPFTTPETDVVPPAGVDVVGNSKVVVHVTIDEELVSRKLPGLPVTIRGDVDPTKWTIKPPQVEVTLTGALLAVEKGKATAVPVVKLAPGDKGREVPVSVDGLPPGIGVKISPERVTVAPAR